MGTRVIDPILAMSMSSGSITTADAYGDAQSLILDLRGVKEKSILVKNAGGANGLTWNILGSVDDGATYDITVKSDANVAFGAQEFYNFSVYYTHLKIQAKSQVAGNPTTAVIKLAGIGV